MYSAAKKNIIDIVYLYWTVHFAYRIINDRNAHAEIIW